MGESCSTALEALENKASTNKKPKPNSNNSSASAAADMSTIPLSQVKFFSTNADLFMPSDQQYFYSEILDFLDKDDSYSSFKMRSHFFDRCVQNVKMLYAHMNQVSQSPIRNEIESKQVLILKKLQLNYDYVIDLEQHPFWFEHELLNIIHFLISSMAAANDEQSVSVTKRKMQIHSVNWYLCIASLPILHHILSKNVMSAKRNLKILQFYTVPDIHKIQNVPEIKDIILQNLNTNNGNVRVLHGKDLFGQCMGDNFSTFVCLNPFFQIDKYHIPYTEHDIPSPFKLRYNADISELSVVGYPLVYIKYVESANQLHIGGGVPLWLYRLFCHKRVMQYGLETNEKMTPFFLTSFGNMLDTFVYLCSYGICSGGVLSSALCDHVTSMTLINGDAKEVVYDSPQILKYIACNLDLLGIVTELQFTFNGFAAEEDNHHNNTYGNNNNNNNNNTKAIADASSPSPQRTRTLNTDRFRTEVKTQTWKINAVLKQRQFEQKLTTEMCNSYYMDICWYPSTDYLESTAALSVSALNDNDDGDGDHDEKAPTLSANLSNSVINEAAYVDTNAMANVNRFQTPCKYVHPPETQKLLDILGSQLLQNGKRWSTQLFVAMQYNAIKAGLAKMQADANHTVNAYPTTQKKKTPNKKKSPQTQHNRYQYSDDTDDGQTKKKKEFFLGCDIMTVTENRSNMYDLEWIFPLPNKSATEADTNANDDGSANPDSNYQSKSKSEERRKIPDLRKAQKLFLVAIALYKDILVKKGCYSHTQPLIMNIIQTSSCSLSPAKFDGFDFAISFRISGYRFISDYEKQLMKYFQKLTDVWYATNYKYHHQKCQFMKPVWNCRWNHLRIGKSSVCKYIRKQFKSDIDVFNEYRVQNDESCIFMTSQLRRIFIPNYN